MSNRISRKTMLKGMGAFALAALSGKLYLDGPAKASPIPCRMLGPSRDLGHRIRDQRLKRIPADLPKRQDKVVIIGGGIAGLSAGWWLKRNHFSDFVLLEMETHVGGNSSSGQNRASAYPWGAHYVPLANPESVYVRQIFEEFGIIEGYDTRGLPIYNQLYLCHEPQERLLKDGTFQEGMVPHRGLQAEDKNQIAKFFDVMHKWKQTYGHDGKIAFAIPLDTSSRDPALLALDTISMSQWLHDNNFDSLPLKWYVDYCCRDDYGSTSPSVSAWAGIHYFAARRGAGSNSDGSPLVTWPEGNGFLVGKLKAYLQQHIITGAAVARLEQESDKVTAAYLNTHSNQLESVESNYAVFCAPRFIAPHVIADYNFPYGDHLSYSPWMVANVTVTSVPQHSGAPLSWDNVSYTSDSLGYVVANHQSIVTREGDQVLTYYYPLSQSNSVSARKHLLSMPASYWSSLIVEDLERMHPGITDNIISIDLWPWGHGMIRPAVNFIWGDSRAEMKKNLGNIYFAHSDMSGMSNFEEAQYHGVEAAKAILASCSGSRMVASFTRESKHSESGL